MKATAAVLFGSVARGEAGPESDLDLLVVRPAECAADDPIWQSQLSEVQASATAWTGNDARILEYGEEELPKRSVDPVLDEALRDGIGIAGSVRQLGQVAFYQGDYGAAEPLLDEAVALAQELGDDYSEATALQYLAGLGLGRGAYARARELLDRTLSPG